MDIKCIFYSKFDLKIGAVVSQQTPPNFITEEIITKLQNYFIPDKENLCGKLTVLSLKPDLCLVGLPVNIENQKYERGCFEFNFGMIVTEQCFHRLPYRVILEQVLRKMAFYLCSIELESETLSKAS